MLYPIVLAGGEGSRLWPLSRRSLPKQFADLLPHQQPLFTATLQRLQKLEDCAPATVVCSAELRFVLAQQLRQLAFPAEVGAVASSILLEPVARNTAPAVTMAALEAQRRDRQAVLLVLPADHMIDDIMALQSALQSARQLALNGSLVTFGIIPNAPETGYGYIRRGRELGAGSGFEVAAFAEKPDRAVAQRWLDEGGYYWNSGMFVFRAEVYLQELEKLAPAIHGACRESFRKMQRDDDFLRIPEPEFAACPGESIDCAVMEKTSSAAVVPLQAGWTDLGSWDAVWQRAEKDRQGNAVLGDVIHSAVSDCYVQAQSRLVALLGITDQVVVETPDAVLVAARDRGQEVKDLVQRLRLEGRREGEHHAVVHRPWGWFQSLIRQAGYQVKRIAVNPGAAISLQRHRHRSEHWTVVVGSAMVHCDGREFLLHQNQTAFIPLGSRHRLSNPGSVVTEIIEIQVGDYLGEDDIERFADHYGREDPDIGDDRRHR